MEVMDRNESTASLTGYYYKPLRVGTAKCANILPLLSELQTRKFWLYVGSSWHLESKPGIILLLFFFRLLFANSWLDKARASLGSKSWIGKSRHRSSPAVATAVASFGSLRLPTVNMYHDKQTSYFHGASCRQTFTLLLRQRVMASAMNFGVFLYACHKR